MLPKFFDIHAHVNDIQFDSDRMEVLARMREAGVWSIQVGTDRKSSQEVAMMSSFVDEGVFCSIGVHPIDDMDGRFVEELFTDLAKYPRVVAVGECGLDYSRLVGVSDIPAEKARQKELFEAQIDFALAHDLPLMVHCRDSDKKLADAHRDVLAIFTKKKKLAGTHLRGNIHFFSQTIDIAREYFALDFTISFTGVITFSHEYDEVIRLAPLDRIMSETDCPYVAPVPHRGKRNEPIFVEEVVRKIAEIRSLPEKNSDGKILAGEDYETVRKALVQNALRVFSISV